MRLLLTAALVIGLTACGDKGSTVANPGEPIDYYQACSSDALFVGGWNGTNLNELNLGGDCFGQTNDSCDLRFTYYKPVNNQILINVNSTSGATSCPSQGEHICTFQHEDIETEDEALLINCGDGDLYYFPR